MNKKQFNCRRGCKNFHENPILSDFLPYDPHYEQDIDSKMSCFTFKNIKKFLWLVFEVFLISGLGVIFIPVIKSRISSTSLVTNTRDTNQCFQKIHNFIDEDSYQKLFSDIEELKCFVKEIENLRLEMQKELKKVSNVDEKISNAIKLYDSDKIGLLDYANIYLGGKILDTPDTSIYSNGFNTRLNIFKSDINTGAQTIIQPGNMPGQCFAFEGNTGKIKIQLAAAINITAFTIEHAQPELVKDYSSAPKQLKIIGYEKEVDIYGFELANFIFNPLEGALQTFPANIREDCRKECRPFQCIELQINSNHGNPKYTCVYRFRVHGDVPKTVKLKGV